MVVNEKVRNAVILVKKKALPVLASASVAMSAVAVNAFAITDENTSIYSTISESFKSGIQDCVDGVVLIMSACIPVAIGIIGMYAAVGAGKRIFTKLVG